MNEKELEDKVKEARNAEEAKKVTKVDTKEVLDKWKDIKKNADKSLEDYYNKNNL